MSPWSISSRHHDQYLLVQGWADLSPQLGEKVSWGCWDQHCWSPSCNLVPSHHRLCSSLSSPGTWAQADYRKGFGMQIFRAGWSVNPCPKQWAGCWTKVWLWWRAALEGKQTARLRKYCFHLHPHRQEAKELCAAAHGVTIMAPLVYNWLIIRASSLWGALLGTFCAKCFLRQDV